MTTPDALTRRDLFNWGTHGLAATALTALLDAEAGRAADGRRLGEVEFALFQSGDGGEALAGRVEPNHVGLQLGQTAR